MSEGYCSSQSGCRCVSEHALCPMWKTEPPQSELTALRARLARLEGALRGALDGYDEVMAHIGGCSDGYCLVVRPPKGSMVTNGGCRCTDNRLTARRIAGASSRLRHVLREALSGRY
jgi:hypothetical protein